MSELTKPDWADLKKRRKLGRAQRKRTARKRLPQLRAFCARHGIEMLSVDGGYQFKYREYVISWLPATNRVLVQYRIPGHNQTVPFTKDGQEGKPRIQVALEDIVDLYSARPRLHTHDLRVCG